MVLVRDILFALTDSGKGRTIDLPTRDASRRGILRIFFSIPPENNSILPPGPASAPSTGSGYRRPLWRVHS
jgi:hypothetical protein